MVDFERLWMDLRKAVEAGADAPLHPHEAPGFKAVLECMTILEDDAGVPEHLEEKRAIENEDREVDDDGP